MIETQVLDNLVDKTVFLKLTFGRFGVTRQVNVEIKSEAVESRFSHQKKLLVSPELKAITKADAEIKAKIDSLCLPYDVGIRFAPVASVEQINSILADYTSTRQALINAFISTYAQQVDEAKAELKEFFDYENYPLEKELREQFTFSYQFISFSVPGHLKNVAPSVFVAEKEKAHEMLMEAAQGISQALATTAHELVSNLADKLSSDEDGKKKKLHATAVTKLQEFLNGFDLRNVTDSVELKKEMDKLKEIMSGVDIEKIRHSDNLQADLCVKFKESAETLGTLIQVKGRKFRD